ncbi:MAG: hypothetical protein HY900_24855 [Deltaproteobacteria bacterium]|nr:hypothetical protein [Deltaproteobacteria bacterium]
MSEKKRAAARALARRRSSREILGGTQRIGKRFQRAPQAPQVVLTATRERCVESAARDEYRSCHDACIRTDSPPPELADRLEILGRFLQSADFPALRRRSELLFSSGRTVRFALWLKEQGVRWRVESSAA